MEPARRRWPVVLGLCAFTHDSSAALIANGALHGFAEEERLNGEKHTSLFPAHTVEWLLDSGGLEADAVSLVAYNFDYRLFLRELAQVPQHLWDRTTRERALPRAASFVRVFRHQRRRLAEIKALFPLAHVAPVAHHRAHGLYAFASSGFDRSAILVVDSLGETQSTSIAVGRRTANGGCDYELLDSLQDPASLGFAYGAVTEHLGWSRGDGEGTVMALAALGDPARFRNVLRDAIPATDSGFELNPRYFLLRIISHRSARVGRSFAQETCERRNPDEPVGQVHADLAAALQERTELLVARLARRAQVITGSRTLCLAGGVAMNCVAVGKIAEGGWFDEVHVPPSPGDGGTSIGAALALHLETSNRLPEDVTDRCYLGPAAVAVDLPAEPRPGLKARRLAEPASAIVTALADGQIVGLFQGRVEAGPRALGNRSILASPLAPDVVDRLNKSVKFREAFRPFAPAVLADRQNEYFTLAQAVPYMSAASGVTALAAEVIPAVVHVNGTARIQTVTPERNRLLADVIAHFDRLTGVPVLINTSFNVKGRPICGTLDMALDCLAATGMDAAWIEGWWVTK